VGLTYKGSGVDADLGDALVDRIGARAKATLGPGVVSGIGGFASLFSLKDFLRESKRRGRPLDTMDDPLIVAGTDGVGTKLKLAFALGKHDTVGIDLVAMCVNDVLTTGATPLFFLDYFGTGRLDVDVAAAVIGGVTTGCERARCALVGGETAELPGLYAPGEYDLAGFAVGVVDRPALLDGKAARVGDRLIGVASSGLHSNGYSLARKALLEVAGHQLDAQLPGLDRPLGEVLIEPTLIYTDAIEALLTEVRPRALAHITGGGIPGNVPRVLPDGLDAVFSRAAWTRPAIYDHILAAGVELAELETTFNVGLGLVVVVAPEDEARAVAALRGTGAVAWSVGEVRALADGAAPALARIEP
jgi:phosphoribosylformylglycinamidine cyclo-ligase